METAGCFVRYLVPAVLALVVVALLTVFNHFVGPLIWDGRLAERMEVFSYSTLLAGPLAFAVSFLLLFYGIELRKEPWPFAKAMFTVACVMAVVGFIANIYGLPTVKNDILKAQRDAGQDRQDDSAVTTRLPGSDRGDRE
jgi:hypothetical protein